MWNSGEELLVTLQSKLQRSSLLKLVQIKYPYASCYIYNFYLNQQEILIALVCNKLTLPTLKGIISTLICQATHRDFQQITNDRFRVTLL